jgi:hypothetical protein
MRSSTSLLTKIALLSPLLALPGVDAIWPKRGLAANEDIPLTAFGGSYNGDGSQVNWQYNWDSTTGQKQAWAEYVPMLWGLAADHTSQWSNNANYWLNTGGSGHLLSFNEPEQSGQSNLSPAAAAAGFRQYMQPFAGRTNLGSPAVSNDGYSWMQQFLSACSDCKIDFLAIHWYNDYTLFSDFQNWVNSMCTLGNGRQVWITEVRFAPLPISLSYLFRMRVCFFHYTDVFFFLRKYSSRPTEPLTSRVPSSSRLSLGWMTTPASTAMLTSGLLIPTSLSCRATDRPYRPWDSSMHLRHTGSLPSKKPFMGGW